MLARLLQNHTSAGFRSAVENLKQEFAILRLHRKGMRQAQKLAGQQHLKLQLGCGPKIKSGWVNVDLSPQSDITLDIREPLPLPTKSCEVVYSEHVLEHFDYPGQARDLLAECFRVLEPGGLISVGVPDTEWPLAEYMGVRNENYFQIAKQQFHPGWCQTEMEHINYHFRQGTEHKFAYDFKTLAKVLEQVGFENIQRREFDQDLDSEDRRIGTLYVNATKPSAK